MSYNTDYSKGMNFLKPDGGESIEARYAGAPNPAFYAKADEIVKEAFKYDLICDMYAESQTRAIQNPAYLRYVAARFGSFANVWLQLDVEWNEYLTATQTKEIGTRLRSYLPYTTPLSVISTNNWNTGLNGPWCTHVCIQGKVVGLRNSYNAIIAQRKLGGGIPCNNDDNGVNGFQNDYKNITAEHEVERMLGCFLGAGYSGTGHEIGLSSPKIGYNGPFWTGGFDPTKHTCSYNLKYMREIIDTKTEFWKMVPEVKGIALKDLDNPGTAVPTTAYALMGNEGAQYILGANKRFNRLSATLPEGTWKVEQFDLVAMKSDVLSTQARDTFTFATPDSKASMTLFIKATSTAVGARRVAAKPMHAVNGCDRLYDMRGRALGLLSRTNGHTMTNGIFLRAQSNGMAIYPQTLFR